jgi:hypothetical protein
VPVFVLTIIRASDRDTDGGTVSLVTEHWHRGGAEAGDKHCRRQATFASEAA